MSLIIRSSTCVWGVVDVVVGWARSMGGNNGSSGEEVVIVVFAETDTKNPSNNKTGSRKLLLAQPNPSIIALPYKPAQSWI